jgi:hypothetical protein
VRRSTSSTPLRGATRLLAPSAASSKFVPLSLPREGERQDPTGLMASRRPPSPDERSPRKRSSGARRHSAATRYRLRPRGGVRIEACDDAAMAENERRAGQMQTSSVTKTQPSDRLGSGQPGLLLAVYGRPKRHPSSDCPGGDRGELLSACGCPAFGQNRTLRCSVPLERRSCNALASAGVIHRLVRARMMS